MSGETIIPRVNKGYMTLYSGQPVRLVAKVLSVQGSTAEVQASDGGKVRVEVDGKEAIEYAPGAVVELMGHVKGDGLLEQYKWTPFSENFDMENFEQLVQLQHMHTNIFGTRGAQ